MAELLYLSAENIINIHVSSTWGLGAAPPGEDLKGVAVHQAHGRDGEARADSQDWPLSTSVAYGDPVEGAQGARHQEQASASEGQMQQ